MQHHVAVAAGDHGVGLVGNVGQRVGLAVHAGELVGDDDHLGAAAGDLLAVHHQVGIGVAVTFLGDQNAVQAQVLSQLGHHVGVTLLVHQEHVLVGQDDAHEVDGLAVLLVQLLNDGVVQVMIGGHLVAGSHAVAAGDGAVHDLGGIHDGGDELLGVHAIVIGVVQQALGLQHVDIANLGQVGILSDLLQQGLGLVSNGLVGSLVTQGLGQIDSGLQTSHTAGVLVHMGLQALLGLDDHAHVLSLGEGAVVGGGAGHVDDALLEAHDAAHGHDHGAVHAVGAALAHLSDLAHDAGEHAAIAGHLDAGLDNVLDGGDAAGLAGVSQLDLAADQTVVLQHQLGQLVSVDVQHALFNLGLLTKLNIMDMDFT